MLNFNAKIETSAVQIASIIRKAITEGNLKPGERLKETEISKSLGVSRSPIREAFRILEAEGLIKIHANRSTTVTRFQEKDIEEIYDLRKLLELHGFQLAWKHLVEDDFKEIDEIISRMERSMQAVDYLEYRDNSHEFHEYYLERCGNDRLFGLFKLLRNSILAIQVFSYSYPDHGSDSLQEHKEILTAMKEKDFETAKERLEAHLEFGLERAKKYLKR